MVGGGGGVLELGEESPLEPKNMRKERSNENPTTKRMSGKGSSEEGGSRPLWSRWGQLRKWQWIKLAWQD